MKAIIKSFVHIRIDDRLIYGQVATHWFIGLKVNRIMVIDDAVANNPAEKSIVAMAVPAEVRTSILGFDKIVANIKNGNYNEQIVMLIVKSPITLVKMMEEGIDLLPVNIGNMSNRPGTTQYKKSISMTPEEKEAVDTLLKKGIKVTAQMVPDDPEVSIENFF